MSERRERICFQKPRKKPPPQTPAEAALHTAGCLPWSSRVFDWENIIITSAIFRDVSISESTVLGSDHHPDGPGRRILSILDSACMRNILLLPNANIHFRVMGWKSPHVPLLIERWDRKMKFVVKQLSRRRQFSVPVRICRFWHNYFTLSNRLLLLYSIFLIFFH